MQGCLWQKQRQPQQQSNEAPTGQTAVARNGERASREIRYSLGARCYYRIPVARTTATTTWEALRLKEADR